MNCQEVRENLSLYLYGELDFAREEELEIHLGKCAFCERSLALEKQWHTAINGQLADVPLDLLAKCRQELRPLLSGGNAKRQSSPGEWFRWGGFFNASFTRWSSQIALASLLVFAGFAAARWMDRQPTGATGTETIQAGLFNPATARIRDIQAGGEGRVRIVFDQESEVSGNATDERVRQLLFAATREADPGVRVYSFEVLNNQSGSDLREVLINSVRNDPNAAVRLKALEGLRNFMGDPATLATLEFVLEHDDNPGVRSQAIDLLLPADQTLPLTPALVDTLQDVVRATPGDEYVRGRCIQLLREAKLPADVY